MSNSSKILLSLVGWFIVISSLHLWLNVGLNRLGIFSPDVRQETFRVGFLPVT